MKLGKARFSTEQVKKVQAVIDNMDAEQICAVWDIQRVANFDGYSTAALAFGGAVFIGGLFLKGFAKYNNFDKIVKMIE